MRKGTRGLLGLRERRLEKPLLALGAALDGQAFIKAVFRLLRAAVACDFVNVSLRHVPKKGNSVAYRMIDSLGREFRPEVLEKFFSEEHPGMPVLMANPGIRFINTRETLPPEAVLRRSRFYRESMRALGFRHAIGMFFWDDPPRVPEAVFSLLRVEGQPDFDDAEVAALDALYPHIAAAFRRVRATEKERALRKELHALAQGSPRAVCVLDWDLRVAEVNRTARELCALWHVAGGERDVRCLKPPPFRLPAPLREACLELKARWNASLRKRPVAGAPERRVVPHPQRAGLRATVAMHVPEAAPLGKPGFLVEFEPVELSPHADGAEKRRLRPAALDSLTARERELVQLVCAGKSNQEIATHLGKALGSVKNGLHTIFKKLRVPSRGGLIAAVRV